MFAIHIFFGSVRNNVFKRESGVLQNYAQNIKCWRILMISLTSVFLGIGDTGSGNAAYISGLVMTDVTTSCCKGILVCCRRWDHPFYLSSLLLGDLRWANWRVTMLVPFSSIFYILCFSCLFVTRGLEDL